MTIALRPRPYPHPYELSLLIGGLTRIREDGQPIREPDYKASFPAGRQQNYNKPLTFEPVFDVQT